MEVIESYNEYIKKIPNGTKYIAECLRVEKLQEAFQVIKDFSEGVSWITEVSQLLKEKNVNVNLNIDQIHTFFEEINEGLENKDYVLVADIFEYEIAPFFEETPLIKTIS